MESTRNGKPHGELIVGGDREVVEQAKRRSFTARYKLKVLEQTDGMAIGEIGAFLRREGLYSSHLSTWRKLRRQGALTGLQPRKRGRKELSADERLTRRIAQVEKEKAAVEEKLRKANLILAAQKKVLSVCEQLGLLSDESSQS